MDKIQAQWLDLVEGRTTKPFEESELTRVRDIAVNSYRQQMKNLEALIPQISGSDRGRRLAPALPADGGHPQGDAGRCRSRAQGLLRAGQPDAGSLPAGRCGATRRGAGRAAARRAPGAAQGPPKVEEGEQLEPIPSVLESRTVRTKLPSGIELHTLRKRTRGNSVQVQIQAQWGDRDTTYKRLGTGMVGQLLNEGTAQISKQQVQDAFIKLRGFWREQW